MAGIDDYLKTLPPEQIAQLLGMSTLRQEAQPAPIEAPTTMQPGIGIPQASIEGAVPPDAIPSQELEGQPAPAPAPQDPALPFKRESSSFTGITEQGNAKAKGIFGDAEKRAATRIAPLQAQAAGDVTALGDAMGRQATANSEAARVTSEFNDRERKLAMDDAAFQMQAKQTEEAIDAEVKAMNESYVSQYKEQVAAVRAMTVDPTGPIGQMSRWEAGGLSLAMFAQGFLAAQGIQIDVGGQIDRWVDRHINEQERRIQQAEKGAQDTLNLWQFAKESAADDFEARQRMRGFTIAAAQSFAKANASRFNSDIANARAAEANAKLEVEMLTTERTIRDSHFAKTQQVLTTEYDRAYKQGQLARESQRNALERDKFNYQKEQDAKKTVGEAPGDISDPEEVEIVGPDGKPQKVLVNRWELDPAKGADAAKQALNARNAWGQYKKDFGALQKLYQEIFNDPAVKVVNGIPVVGQGMSVRMHPKMDQYRALKSSFTRSQLRIESGLTVTDQEWKEMMSRYPDEKLVQVGDSMDTFMQMQEQARGKYQVHMDTYAKKKEQPTIAGRAEASPQTGQDWKNFNNGGPAQTNPVDALTTQAVEKNSSKDVGTPNAAFKKFTSELQKKQPDRMGTDGWYPEWAAPMEQMARLLVDPDFLGQAAEKTGESSAALAEKAAERLSHLADDETITTDKREFARYLFHRIGDHEGLRADLDTVDDESKPLRFK